MKILQFQNKKYPACFTLYNRYLEACRKCEYGELCRPKEKKSKLRVKQKEKLF